MLNSDWSVPLPLEEYLNYRVVVYSVSDGWWIPIKYCRLSRAIELYHRILLETNQEVFVFVFPTNFDPNLFNM
ncbi:hypothetical protein [Nostoc sp. MG11]|uniref:hypothetical protein n=1 Tax=Nostoc sp. MG11 TaxID=2721166 RepID=UPI001D008392|nr:hypothetical protein [Nostoc sp. MG11]